MTPESERVFRRGSVATLILSASLVALLAFAARAQPTDLPDDPVKPCTTPTCHAENLDQVQLPDPSSRSYTAEEIDQLRNAVCWKLLATRRSYYKAARIKEIEEQVRTYMQAGIKAKAVDPSASSPCNP